MVYQALWWCWEFLCRQLIQLNMEAFLWSSTWRSSHLELSNQIVSNKTNQFLAYAMHVVGISLGTVGSFLCAVEVDWHVKHLFTVWQISSVFRGQKSDSLEHNKHFLIPWWPSCIRSNISICSVCSMSILCYFNKIPSSMEISSL